MDGERDGAVGEGAVRGVVEHHLGAAGGVGGLEGDVEAEVVLQDLYINEERGRRS